MDEEKIDRLVTLADEFFEEVLPQAGRLTFQRYDHVNELGLLLTEYKREKGRPIHGE